MKHKYYVTTWETQTQRFTPQKGVRKGPWSLWGLRRALRILQTMGYAARKGDEFVLVERDDGGVDAEEIAKWRANQENQ